MIKETLKKRLDKKFAKCDLKYLEQIITASDLKYKDKYKEYFVEYPLLFLDISSVDPIGFSYERIYFFNQNDVRTLEFRDVLSVEIDNSSLFTTGSNNLWEAKSTINSLMITCKNGEKENLNVANEGAVNIYKSLIELAIFVLKSQ